MASIAVYIPNSNKAVMWKDRKQSDFALYMMTSDKKIKFGAPFAPKEVTYANWGKNWTQVPRDGQTPYLVDESTKLPTMSFTLVIARSGYVDVNMTDTLKVLKSFAQTSVPIQIRYGGWFESVFQWRCTNITIRSINRRPGDNAITHAEVDMEFTAARDVVLKAGPIKGQPAKPPKPTGKNVGKRKYKLKKTHSLHFLADHFYGSTKYWRFLADINKIKNPKTSSQLKAGRTIIY